MEVNTIICGDCKDVMRGYPDNSFDAIVTDPPYGLEFMGKEWDKLDAGIEPTRTSAGGCLAYSSARIRYGKSVKSMQQWHYDWSAEALRIAKPGAFLLCFGGTRTSHRLTCGLEDAGWQIRDCFMWLYGSGFPKSTNISQQFDKKACYELGVKQFGRKPTKEEFKKAWEGFRKIQIEQKEDMYGDYEQEKRQHNIANKGDTKTGRYNWNTEHTKRKEFINITAPATDLAKLWDGYGTALKPAWEPIIVAMKPLGGTFAANAEKWGVAGLNIDESRISLDGEKQPSGSAKRVYKSNQFTTEKIYGENTTTPPQGRWPANLILGHHPACKPKYPSDTSFYELDDEYHGPWSCHPDCPVRLLDEQSGISKSAIIKGGGSINYTRTMEGGKFDRVAGGFADSGGASRFFKNIVDDSCSLCYNTYTKTINKETELWKQLYVPNAEKSSKTTNATSEFIARLDVLPRPKEQFVQNVKSVENLCDLCAISIAHALVAIKTSAFNKEELHLILGCISNSKRCILIQNLVSFAELWGNIDIIPTTTSLTLLFGSVHLATKNSIPKTEKSAPSRFRYTPKASRAERNAGLEGMEGKSGSLHTKRKPNSAGLKNPASKGNWSGISQNHHPTVKPLALMEYLCRLLKPPTEHSVLLDPFCGSGTTLMAAVNTGWDYVGIDKEKEYVEIAEKRVAYVKRQGQMPLFEKGE